ncbi:hypothetical protein U9M48_021158 [Paspalum notatum var. saurae]|uniref:Uncharacterized protein n=1 Tax=Paspalum notatum var. saurae TaxID=547442 RepID=A0AAQ3TIZ2_PASNO
MEDTARNLCSPNLVHPSPHSPLSLRPFTDSGDLRRVMAATGEASSKLLRFLCFVGAGVICTKAINTYRDYEHKKEASAAVAAAESALAAAAAAAEPAPATAAAAAAKP